jgi:hypothetical protein
MVSRLQPEGVNWPIEKDLDVLRAIHRDRDGYLAIGATVATPGRFAVGDEVQKTGCHGRARAVSQRVVILTALECNSNGWRPPSGRWSPATRYAIRSANWRHLGLPQSSVDANAHQSCLVKARVNAGGVLLSAGSGFESLAAHHA